MNTSITMMIAALVLSALGVAAYRKRTSPSESSVGTTANDLGDAVGDTAKDAMDAAEQAGSTMKEAAQNAD